MRPKLHVLLLIPLTILGAVLLLVGGEAAIPIGWVRALVWLGVVCLLGVVLFDASLWRLPVFHRRVRRPDMRGTWRAQIQSSWTDPTTGKPLEAIEGFMAIEQTFFGLRLRLMTTESTSEALEASVLNGERDTYRVAAIYKAIPVADSRHRGSGHCGTLLLNVPGRRPRLLDGHYVTDRETEGRIVLSDRKRRLFETYRSAHVAYEKGRKAA